MSYSRSFNRTVRVHYSGSKSVSYPASQSGGTISVNYSGYAEEDVTVEVRVNTTPFDSSVANCSSNVGALTASVGAMNAAQCQSIADNADRVSETIINGFFHTVRCDLSTQQTELEQTISSRLMLLRKQADMLREKRENMEADYARTTARYQKLFADLNNELSTRIHEVDKPVYAAAADIEKLNDRMLHTDMIQSAVTMGRESGILQAQISAACVKHHALEAMNQVQNFLITKADSERTVRQSFVEGSGRDRYWVPVCFMETTSEGSRVERQCVTPQQLGARHKDLESRLCEALAATDISEPSASETEQVKSYFESEIAKNISGDDDASRRLRETIYKLFNI